MKFFKRNPKEVVMPEVDLRNFRFLGEEAEALGLRWMQLVKVCLNLLHLGHKIIGLRQ